MELRSFDVMLATAIALSGGFVGYRIITRNTSSSLGALSERPDATLEALHGSRLGDRDPAEPSLAGRFHPISNVLLAARPLSEKEWTLAKRLPGVARSIVSATRACEAPFVSLVEGYPIVDPNIKARFTEGSLAFLMSAARNACLKKNSRVKVFYVGLQGSDPVFEALGSIVVSDIIEVHEDAFVQGEYNSLFSEPPSRLHLALRDDFSAAKGTLWLYKFSKLPPESITSDLPVPGFPLSVVVRSDRLVSWLKTNEKPIIVDVRSPKEQAEVPLRYAGRVVSVPYSVNDGNWRFRWDRNVSEVGSDLFEVAKIVNLRGLADTGPLLFVGAAPFDGRPPWALFSILPLNLKNTAWFYDGVESFNDVIRAPLSPGN